MAEEFLTFMADLDESAQTRMSEWYDALREAGFTGRQTPGLPFHISLATFPLDKEQEAVEITQKAAAAFAAVPVHISHMGLFAGGRVLFCGPERNRELEALQAACEKYPSKYPWTPHATMLIDEPDTVCAALPILVQSFRPLTAQITRLHLCAFWPTREILSVQLKEGSYDGVSV